MMDDSVDPAFESLMIFEALSCFKGEFVKMYGFDAEDDMQSLESVNEYVRKNCGQGVIKTDGNDNCFLEMGPPAQENVMIEAHYVSVMETYRGFFNSFELGSPYDEDNDVLATTPYAKDIEDHNGAVVFNKSSKDKPHKPVYEYCADFVKKLEGVVLVVGDVNGGIASRLFRQDFYALPVDEFWSVEHKSWNFQSKDRLIDWEDVPTFLQKHRLDHIVYLFRPAFKVDPIVLPDVKEHFLDFIPSAEMFENGPGDYTYKGKRLTVWPAKKGRNATHASICGAAKLSTIGFLMQWVTDIIPTMYSPSVIPLTQEINLGSPETLMMSEKSNGVPAELLVSGGEAELRIFLGDDSQVKVVKDRFALDEPDALFLCEVIDTEVVILEPVIYPARTFEEWVKKCEFMVRSGNFRYSVKDWCDLTKERCQRYMSEPYEGFVVKRKMDRIGQMDPTFKKIRTFYIKNPRHASYEDYINQMKEDEGTLLRGYHAIYEDIFGVFEGEGVYEVGVNGVEVCEKLGSFDIDISNLPDPPPPKIVTWQSETKGVVRGVLKIPNVVEVNIPKGTFFRPIEMSCVDFEIIDDLGQHFPGSLVVPVKGIHLVRFEPGERTKFHCEVFVKSKVKPIFRKRNKKMGDPTWYYDAVCESFNYEELFRMRMPKMFDILSKDSGGVMHFKGKPYFHLPDNAIVQQMIGSDGGVKIKFEHFMNFALYQKILWQSRIYSISMTDRRGQHKYCYFANFFEDYNE